MRTSLPAGLAGLLVLACSAQPQESVDARSETQAVWEAVVADAAWASHPLCILSSTVVPEPEAPRGNLAAPIPEQDLRRALPRLLPETLDSFRSKVSRKRPLAAAVGVARGGTHIPSRDHFVANFGERREGSKLIELSAVGMHPQGIQALVYRADIDFTGQGQGEYVLLERGAVGWFVSGRHQAWRSWAVF